MVDNETKRKPGRPRTFNPDQVLDKVTDAFWELGYERADTETLARVSGLTKPSLYNAFGTKEDLFVAAIKRYRKIRSTSWFEALNRADTPVDGIRNYFLELAKNVAGEDHPPGCLLMSVAMPQCDRLPKVATALGAIAKESMNQLIDYFDGQKNEGKLPKDFNNTAAIALLHDLGTAMTVQGRYGARLAELKCKAERNAELVLYSGIGKAPV